MDGEAPIILSDLARHAEAFRLDSDGLGESALSAARAGVVEHFSNQVDPDGVPWPELSRRYRAFKERHWPGLPINVREGLMRSELEGESSIEPGQAVYTAGQSAEGRAEIGYAEDPDPTSNRPPRKFVDLNPGSIAESDHLFDRHFEEKTQP
jgi:hypothetical protein